jgi:hypothetical protein
MTAEKLKLEEADRWHVIACMAAEDKNTSINEIKSR